MDRPFVSIIIPNLNNQDRLDQCLAGLMRQTYPPEDREIIVVDNGSTDGSLAIAGQFAVKILQDTEYKSPYWCRNAGIREARGDILVLLDSNCVPTPNWLKSGINSLKNTKAGIVTGPVRFNFSVPPTLAEKIDYLYSVFTPEDIASCEALPATHLFIKRQLFEDVGFFIPHIRSRGDMEWTHRAHRKGYSFGYAENAVVDYPAKTLPTAIRKMIRLGGGKKELWLHEKKSLYHPKWILQILKNLFPPAPDFYQEMAQRNQDEGTRIPAIPLYLGLYLIKLCYAWGMLFKKVNRPIKSVLND